MTQPPRLCSPYFQTVAGAAVLARSARRHWSIVLKLYCNRYQHFKDPLVCAVNCIYRTRCDDFALFYAEHREAVDQTVADYLETRRDGAEHAARHDPTVPVNARALFTLEVKREMPEATFVWIGKDDRAELVGLEEVLRRAERGDKAKRIFKIAQEMELRFQLVPRKKIEKVKRAAAAEAERAEARRSRLRPVAAVSEEAAQVPATKPEEAANTGQRRPRGARAAKAAGDA